MTYADFLEQFATTYGFESKEDLLARGAKRFSFQINSRQRARDTISRLATDVARPWAGMRILDVGCAYGSFCIELAREGAVVVGVDVSKKWLELAEANVRDEGELDVEFVLADASSRECRRKIPGKFDLIIINDGLEHIYDTSGLLRNVRGFLANHGLLFFKVPNGQAGTAVLAEGHKKVFGVSLLPPDYWIEQVEPPFSIYYRRWDHYEALLRYHGLGDIKLLNQLTDGSREVTEAHIRRNLRLVRRGLRDVREDVAARAGSWLSAAVKRYVYEAEADLEELDWYALFFKYRVTFWEGLAAPHGATCETRHPLSPLP